MRSASTIMVQQRARRSHQYAARQLASAELSKHEHREGLGRIVSATDGILHVKDPEANRITYATSMRVALAPTQLGRRVCANAMFGDMISEKGVQSTSAYRACHKVALQRSYAVRCILVGGGSIGSTPCASSRQRVAGACRSRPPSAASASIRRMYRGGGGCGSGCRAHLRF